MPSRADRPRRLLASLSFGLLAGCVGAPDAPARAVGALTVGPELTLVPDLPAAPLPVEALGHAATAAAGAVRATAWSTPRGVGLVAFWSSAGGLLARAELRAADARPVVASDGSVFLVAWHQAGGLVAARFDAAGARLDAAPLTVSTGARVGAAGDDLACVHDGRDFVLAYGLAPAGVEVARVTAAGAVRDRRAVPLLGANLAERVRIAASRAGYLVAATGVYAPTFLYRQLAYARLGPDLAPVDAAPRAVAASPRERGLEDVASDGADYLLLWSDEATPTASAPRLLAARVSAASGDVGAAADVALGTATHPTSAAWAERVAGGYLVARYDGTSFVTRQLRDAGTFVEAAPVARAVGAGLVGQVARAREGAGLTLTWAASAPADTRALAVASLAADGAAGPTAQPVTAPGGTDARAVGLGWDGRSFVTAWSDLSGASWAARTSARGARVDARGVALGRARTEALASTAGQHALMRPTAAAITGGTGEYAAQRYDADLRPVGAERVLFSAERDVMFWGAGGPDGYLLGTGVFYFSGLQLDARFLRADGTLARSVEVYRFRETGSATALAASRALWAVAWTTYDAFARSCGLRVNLYTPAGEFAVVPRQYALPSCEGTANLAAASDGADFLVVWGEEAAGTSTRGLRVRADGAALDAAPFVVGSGGAPRAVWDGANYTVAWSTAPSGSPANQSIVAARVAATGAVLDRPPVTLAEGARGGAAFALAADGEGTVAVAYARATSGEPVRARLRLFQWDAVPSDGGLDAGPDAAIDAAPDAIADAVNDVGSDAVNDVGSDAVNDVGSDAVNDVGSDAPSHADAPSSTPGGGTGCQCAVPHAPDRPAALGAWLVALVLTARRGAPAAAGRAP